MTLKIAEGVGKYVEKKLHIVLMVDVRSALRIKFDVAVHVCTFWAIRNIVGRVAMYAMALLPFVMLESVCLVQKSNLSVLKNASIFEMLTTVEYVETSAMVPIQFVYMDSVGRAHMSLLVVWVLVSIYKQIETVVEHVGEDAKARILFA